MRRFHRSRTWVVPLLAASVAATSCGSGDPPGSETTPPAGSAKAPATELDESANSVNDQTTPSELATTEPAPTQPPTATAVEGDPERVGADCRRLTEFDGDQADRWLVVNDGVMGGRSDGAIDVTDSVMRFTGSVVTAGGGFTSVRLRLNGAELDGTTGVELRVRADQRVYGLTFEDDAQVGQRSVSHRADLAIDRTVDTDGWTTVELSFADLQPSVFGQPATAPAFDPDEASEIGIIIADGLDGEFALDVDWIDACR